VCVRGARALDDWLGQHREAAGFVVWEPVLASDEAPPRTLAAHAHNYWDTERARSAAMLRSGADPACLASGSAEDGIVWDAVFDYAPNRGTPAFCGRPIVAVLDELVEHR
jgi:hypothetical protein